METQNQIIEGYCVVWNDTANLGIMTEVIGKDSFVWDDVVALYGHNRQAPPLGRLKAGTLNITPDDYGLWAELSVPKNRTDVLEGVERQDIYGWSFDTNDTKYTWDFSNKTNKGTIVKNKITEITLTPMPAYAKTSVRISHPDNKNLLKGNK